MRPRPLGRLGAIPPAMAVGRVQKARLRRALHMGHFQPGRVAEHPLTPSPSSRGRHRHSVQRSDAHSMGFSASPSGAGLAWYQAQARPANNAAKHGNTHVFMRPSSTGSSGNSAPVAAGFQRSFQRLTKRKVGRLRQVGVGVEDLLGQMTRAGQQGRSRTKSATFKSGTPLCWVPITSPGPRNSMSTSAISNPSFVRHIVSSRRRASAPNSALDIKMQ